MLKRFLLVWLVNVIGLFTAALLFTGIDYGDSTWVLLVASLIFGLVNALIRPLVVIISLPAIVLTLGFFTLVVNALMLWITSVVYPPFQVKTIGSAIGAVIIVWLVNYLFDVVVLKEGKVS